MSGLINNILNCGLDEKRTDPTILIHYRNLNAISLTLIFLGIPFALWFFSIGVYFLGFALSLTVSLGIVNLILFRHVLNVPFCGHFNTLLVYFYFLAANWFFGGVKDPHYVWFLVVPLFSGLILRKLRPVFLYSTLSLITTVVFSLLEIYKVEMPNQFPLEYRAIEYILNIHSLIFTVSAIVFGFISITNRTNTQIIEARNKAEKEGENKSKFLVQLSHEIRTPLTSILGMNELLQEISMSAEGRQFLTVMHRNSENLLMLVNDILHYSRLENGVINLQYSPFSLQGLASNVVSIMEQKAKDKGLQLLKRNSPETTRFVIGDQLRLNQILINLVGNALKFTEKGEVELSIELLDEEQKSELVALKVKSGEELYKFSVRDTGVGISSEMQEKVFDAFFRVENKQKRLQEGFGLGLDIARQLIELMGGTLQVTSEPGVGSNFYFYLAFRPATTEELETVSDGSLEKILPINSENHSELKILLADDNPDNHFLVRRFLSREPHRIISVETGDEALQAFKNQEFDLVLMDMQMPKMDGLEATSLIRVWEKVELESERRNASVPIYAFTAHALEEEMMRAEAVGCNGHLHKPLKKVELLNVLQLIANSKAESL